MIATASMFRGCPVLTTAVPGMPGRTAALSLLARRKVTAAELVEQVSLALAGRPDCEGLEIAAGPLVPGEPDADGCNWSPSALRLRVAHGPSTRALASVRSVVEWARLSFELAAPES
jgi:hypothetical protein